MALTHHVVVRAAKAILYVILGDDIVIEGVEVAKQYRGIMSRLGVGINRSKSIE
jgi:hypothetical protein